MFAPLGSNLFVTPDKVNRTAHDFPVAETAEIPGQTGEKCLKVGAMLTDSDRTVMK